jgi:hypothetical protein
MRTIDLTAPRNYAEMTEKQVRYVANLQVKGNKEESIWTKCLIKFTGIKAIGGTSEVYYFAKKHLKGFFSMTIEETYSFAKTLDFVTKRYVGIRPLAKIGKYRPCEELLRDITFLQYLDAENYYQAFIFTKSEVHLYELMATLFRIPGEEYSNELTYKSIKRMSTCSEVEKLMVVMWFIGIKEYFSAKFKYLFNRVDVDDDDPSTAPDMLGIVRNQVRMLTEGDVTKEEKVLAVPAWSALSEMDDKCREAKELEARTKHS